MIREIYLEWEQCREALLPAIEMTKGTHNEDDVIAGLLTGQFKLWRNGASGLVTDITTFPRMKCINVFLAGGDIEEILPLQIEIENYGRKNGCQRATMLAVRDGWQKTVEGAQKLGTAMYKDL